jgi:hypothetical protein
MKNIVLIFVLSVFVSCNQKSVTTVKVLNKNNFPVSFTVKANNCTMTIDDIASGQEKTQEFDWTTIEKKDGQWFLFVKNKQSGGVDSFAHGYFPNGELSNYLDVECMGDQLKVQVSE